MAVGNVFQAKCFYQSCISLAPQSKLAENAKAGLAYLDKLPPGSGTPAASGSAKPTPLVQNALIPPLPPPTPGRYSAPDQQVGLGASSAGFHFAGRHRYGQFGYQSSYGYYGAPHMEVRNYSFPPSSTAAATSEPSQVELLAKQSKLVVDEKPSR